MSIKFDWPLFLYEQSLTQNELCKKIARSKFTISPYMQNDYISINMKKHIEETLDINLNKYLIKE